MKKTKIKISEERQVTLDGMMTIGKYDNNLIRADFGCCEDIEMEQFSGRFRVIGMHNGDIYMEQLPKRFKNKPEFREDNSSLSHGKDGYFYVVFRLHESEQEQLPGKLVKQAYTLAVKFIGKYLEKGGKR